jgi:hypothetical protein
MPYSNSQLRGALLEEAILYLLYASGYEPVLRVGGDETLELSTSGLNVRGRGEKHQIDAIADFVLSPPFSNPPRLLVEAKFQRKNVGIPIVRNAVGVLKDVSEYWVGSPTGAGRMARSRYHYLYAVFSASKFTAPAQRYAFAHDIHLLPVRNSAFMAPVVTALEAVDAPRGQNSPPLFDVRNYVRGRTFENAAYLDDPIIPEPLKGQLDMFVEQTHRLQYGLIAMLGNRMPLFLTARQGLALDTLNLQEYVRVRWLEGAWFIERSNGERLFSFDLPEELYKMYASRGALDRNAVANIKDNWMRRFYAYYRSDGAVRVIRFDLDDEWFSAIQQARMDN